MNNSIYSNKHNNFLDKIVIKKRHEMSEIINKYISNQSIEHALDIGTTDDKGFESSNYLIKNLRNIKIYRSISDQKINSKFFSRTLTKSITDNFSDEEIENFSSDLVISNATLEHVGSYQEQLKMLKNIIKLTKKLFIVVTPNRMHPIEFHSKIPFIHWLPKKFHRKILSIIGLKYLSEEKNLNLLKTSNLINLMKNFNNIEFDIEYVNFLLFKSNIILIGKNKDK